MGIKHLQQHDYAKHRLLIYQLLKAGRPQDRCLANILASCTDAHPCTSAACVHCGREFQRAAFHVLEKEIRLPARRDHRGRVAAITLVPTGGCLAPDILTAAACWDIATDIIHALTASGISPFALSLDISFNEDTTGKIEQHWCCHGHLAKPEWLTKAEVEALKRAFPASYLVLRPVRFEQLDRNDEGLLYIVKRDRVRRVNVLNISNPNRQPYRDSKRRILRPWQAVQLAHVEHELGYEYRLITNGLSKAAVGEALDAFYHAQDGP